MKISLAEEIINSPPKMIVFKKEELNKLFDSGMKPGVVYIINSTNSGNLLVEDIYNNIRHATKSEKINVNYYLSEGNEGMLSAWADYIDDSADSESTWANKHMLDNILSDITFKDGGCLNSVYISKDHCDILMKSFSAAEVEKATSSSNLNVLLNEKPVTYVELEKLRKEIKDTNSYAIVIISNDEVKPTDASFSADSLIFVREKEGCIWADSAGSDEYILHNK